MGQRQVFYALLAFLFSSVILSLQVITEVPSSSGNLNAVKYVVTIGPREGRAENDLLDNQITYMTDSAGKRYRCALPNLEETQISNLDAEDPNMSFTWKSPAVILESLRSMCFYRQEGLWTYEMCFKKHARQFRQEGNGYAEEHYCGRYPGDQEQDEEVQEDTALTGTRMKFVRHVMPEGDECHLTSRPRTSEVRFTCVRDVTDNVITMVKEFPACNYIFVVATPFVCRHPDLKPEPEQIGGIFCEAEEPSLIDPPPAL